MREKENAEKDERQINIITNCGKERNRTGRKTRLGAHEEAPYRKGHLS